MIRTPTPSPPPPWWPERVEVLLVADPPISVHVHGSHQLLYIVLACSDAEEDNMVEVEDTETKWKMLRRKIWLRLWLKILRSALCHELLELHESDKAVLVGVHRFKRVPQSLFPKTRGTSQYFNVKTKQWCCNSNFITPNVFLIGP